MVEVGGENTGVRPGIPGHRPQNRVSWVDFAVHSVTPSWHHLPLAQCSGDQSDSIDSLIRKVPKGQETGSIRKFGRSKNLSIAFTYSELKMCEGRRRSKYCVNDRVRSQCGKTIDDANQVGRRRCFWFQWTG